MNAPLRNMVVRAGRSERGDPIPSSRSKGILRPHGPDGDRSKLPPARTVSDSRPRIGRLGEQIAEKWFRRLGYRVITRNWRHRLGEIDLICARGRTAVFIEVKARVRSGWSAEHLFESISPTKERRMLRLAEIFLRTYLPPGEICIPRFDLFGVELPGYARLPFIPGRLLFSRARTTHLVDAITVPDEDPHPHRAPAEQAREERSFIQLR